MGETAELLTSHGDYLWKYIKLLFCFF